MSRRHFLIAVAISAICVGNGVAQQPRKWTPEHPYNIVPNAGPWAICVMSYAGEKAFFLAEKFVTELRRDYKLPAYFFNRSDVERKKEEVREEEMRKKRWALYADLARQMGQADPSAVAPKTVHVKKPLRMEDQFAVLIGGYREMDTARRSLNYVRRLKPPSEELMNQAFVAGPANGGAEVRTSFVNPFVSAFVVPNPTAPKQQPEEIDERELGASLKELNADESFSLLKCPGDWTLVVKVYRAPTIILSQGQDRRLFDRGSRGAELLQASARQAHQLAEVLRDPQLGFDAYVLHTNNMSMVTVGSFTGTNDPRMSEIANRVVSLKLKDASGGTEAFMNPPMPFKVPK